MHLVDRRLIFVVAQVPFEASGGDGGPLNLFSTLAPLVLLPSGEPADPVEFPNNGLVWWMLRPENRAAGEPGRLVTGILELAQKFDPQSPDKTYYQVSRESLEIVHEDDCVEILDVVADIGAPRDFLNRTGIVVTDHPPA